MSDYTKIVDFAAKDALPTGDAAKVGKGSEIDAEFDAIAVAIATKYDSSDRGAANGIAPLDSSGDVPVANLPSATTSAIGAVELATTTEAVTGTDTARAVTPAGVQAVLDQNAGILNDISHLTDPGADRIAFWDDSAGALTWLVAGTGLSISGTSISVVSSGVSHDSTSGFVANEHINHNEVTITAGDGLIGGGTIAANRTIDMGTPSNITASSTNSATASTHTHAVGAGIVKTDPGTGGQITVSTSAPSGGTNGDIWFRI